VRTAEKPILQSTPSLLTLSTLQYIFHAPSLSLTSSRQPLSCGHARSVRSLRVSTTMHSPHQKTAETQ
jgi:hypothetical protein